jgi:hypothetical protein
MTTSIGVDEELLNVTTQTASAFFRYVRPVCSSAAATLVVAWSAARVLV